MSYIKNKIIFLVIQMFTLLILVSCNYRVQEYFSDKNARSLNPDNSSAELLSYQIILDKVMAKNCLNCHSVSGGNRGGLNLEGYANTLKNLNLIREEIISKDMPKSPGAPLSSEQIELITKWIDVGANEFAVAEEPVLNQPTPGPPVVIQPPISDPPAPEPVLLNFETVMKKVIEPKCLKCHGADSATNVVLINYSDLTTFAENIKIAVTSGDMPRRDKLLPEQKKLILNWIQAGLPK